MALKPDRSPSRAEEAADRISAAGQRLSPGDRLGSREDLRALCGVSVGTLHEALRLLQSTGEITVRPGPGGGIFAGERSALSNLLRDVRAEAKTAADFAQTSRILSALAPLVIADAIAAPDDTSSDLLKAKLTELRDASDATLQDFVRASLELFATIVFLPPAGLLRVVAGSIVRAQIDVLPGIDEPIDPNWRQVVDGHRSAVAEMVAAILARDADAALTARGRPEFIALFAALHESAHLH